MKRLVVAIAALLAAASIPPAMAGPVPGQETFDKRPLDFPVPKNFKVFDIGNDEYLVTFRWKPAKDTVKPGVTGSFANWSRTEYPMEGPDAEGFYSVTARLHSGDYPYKFIAGTDGWYQDTENPEAIPDGSGGNNSILRLGISAIIKDLHPARDDNQVFAKGLLHLPGQHSYFDIFTPTDAMIRVRSLQNDVARMDLQLVGGDGTITDVAMSPAGSDEMYEFWEYHYSTPKNTSRPVAYNFKATDGTATVTARNEAWPLILDPSRIVATPDWAKNTIWYQIMVDRFRDGDPSNNTEHTDFKRNGNPPQTAPWSGNWSDTQPWEKANGATFWQYAIYDRLYGGDFQGVIDKLDYLKSLGVTGIYFNPVFEAQGSHKYNARDYHHMDDLDGVAGEYWKSMEKEDLLDASTWKLNASDRKFLTLLHEAKKRGIRVIIDGVFNHVGDEHPAFIDVKTKGKASRFADWFIVESWSPFKYKGWAGFGKLPEFAKSEENGIASASLRTYIFAITKLWMDPNADGDPSDGIDGWRLDVPGEVPKSFWRQWRDVVKGTNPDAYTTGEEWGPAEDWLDGKTFDSVMNYPVAKLAFQWFANKKEKISASEFDARLARHRIRYPRQVTYALQNMMDSHDTDRWVSQIANPDRSYDAGNRLQDNAGYNAARPGPEVYQRLRLMALFQSTYVGAPMIWYGTEVGMYGADDPQCRTPMLWEDKMPFADPDQKIDADLRHYFQELFTLRNSQAVLRTGDFTTVGTWDSEDVLAYLRWDAKEKKAMLVVLNNGDKPATITIPSPVTSVLPKGWQKPKVVLGNGEVSAGNGSLTVKVGGIDGIVVEVRR